MLIRFSGPTVIRRVMGPYEWSMATQFVQDVPADVAADLLTMRDGRFVVDGEESLRQVVPATAEDIVFAGLALAGIGSVYDLSNLDEMGVARVSGIAGLDPVLVSTWAKRARGRFSADEEE